MRFIPNDNVDTRPVITDTLFTTMHAHYYACGYPTCLLLHFNTLHGMLTPLLNVNTFMECQHLCFKQEDQSVRMNEQRINNGAGRVLQLE